jgi:hypothetical protein
MSEQWHVIEAYPFCDAAVEMRLNEMDGVESWRATETVYRADRRARSRRPIHKKGEPRAVRIKSRFAPFVFVKLALGEEPERRWEIERLATYGGDRLVQRFLCNAGTNEPAVIPAELIEFYRDFVPISGASPDCYVVGQRVTLADGPFRDFEGIVTIVDTRGWLWVDVAIFGRPTPVFIEVGHVRPSEMCLTKSPPGRTLKRAADHRSAQSAQH